MPSILLLCLALQSPTQIPSGDGQTEIAVGADRLPIDVFTYKPERYRDGPLVIVCHGVLRNAEEYRDHAKKLGDRLSALIIVPRFDAERFPLEGYQQGGVRKQGKVYPREQWTFSYIPEIAAEIRRREQRPQMPYYMFGHSAGGQFVERLAGFVDSGAVGLVSANPGTHLVPTREQPFPFGFGGLPDELSDDQALERYLAQPLTLYLGTADTEIDEHLDRSPEGQAQGECRLARGRYTFEFARKLAADRGWKFRWRLVEAPDVPHDHELMFNHPQASAALALGE